MRRHRLASLAKLALVCVGLVATAPLARTSTPPPQDAKTIASFTLPDAAGKAWSLADHKGKNATVVFFLGTQCPINNSYAPRLAELYKNYAEKGVGFVAINSNVHDTDKEIAAHAQKFGIPFPVLRDAKQQIADVFGAQRVPEAFVLDAGLKLVYQGRIDDQFGIGYTRPQPTQTELIAALDEVLAGKKVSQPKTEAAGCFITRAPKAKSSTASVTYAKDVSRIMQSRCQECHRPGQIGPMPLLTYDDASDWSAMIREVVSEKRMPPWHADPKHGHFSNDRSLTKQEFDTLLAWIDQGCPKGDEKDLPEPRKFADEWNIGKPDIVLTMPNAYKVPAEAPKGGIPYQHFMVKTNFKEDTYVQGIECKPGAPGVVHHIVLYIVTDASKGFDGFSPLATWVPGDRGLKLTEGFARMIPKGATLIFQMHYTPNGFAQEDKSSVGLVLAKTPGSIMHSKIIVNMGIEIPPGANNHKIEGSTTFTKDVMLYSLMPHMHLRGKSFEYAAVYPDGKREVLLWVPKYDFGWQTTYVLAKPLRLPAGTKLECVGRFDNSKENLNNPDPTATVRWGLQTWQEMLAGVVDYSIAEGEARSK
jgi:peroxiredoxin